MSVELDAAAFYSRATRLFKRFTERKMDPQPDCLLFPVGKSDDAASYSKSIALQTWLLGYEFPDTVLAITQNDGFVFFTSNKKAAILENLNNKRTAVDGELRVPMKVLVRGKTLDTSLPQYEQLFEEILKKSFFATKIGVLTKDQFTGPFIEEFGGEKAKRKFWSEEIDVSAALTDVMAVKDEEELGIVRSAAKCSALLMRYYFVDEMTGILDEDQKVTHSRITEKVTEALYDEKARKKWRFPNSDVNGELLDWCYPPIVQSGAQFDLKPSAVSNDENLQSGVILASLGVRYRSYCSNVGRSYLVDPTNDQEEALEKLVALRTHLLSRMTPGKALAELYREAQQFLGEGYAEYLYKNLGFLTGIEFRESTYVISAKSPENQVLESNAVYNLSIGLQGLQTTIKSAQRSYSLQLCDTVRISDSGEAQLLTGDCSTLSADVCFYLKTEAEEKAEREREEQRRRKEAARNNVILDSKLRNEAKGEGDSTREQKRMEHQRQLFDKLQRDGISKFGDAGSDEDGDANGKQAKSKATFRKFESYKAGMGLPKEVVDLKILVDRRAESVILPIYGQAVPFHIITLKSIAKGTEGEFTTLRFNFNTPGIAGVKKDDILPYENPKAHFVRALTYRSTDAYRIGELFKAVNDLKKVVTQRELQRREMADLVEQSKLKLISGRRPLRLVDAYLRPAVDKKGAGECEIHEDGLRYTNVRGSDAKVDILFSNIKHLIFQPCRSENYAFIHIHLKHPIMIGKKKSHDLQFIREASEAGGIDETSNRRRRHVYGDEDEIKQEEEDRKRRRALDKEFKAFAEEISKASKYVEVDVPYKDLGFTGVPFRNSVSLLPTTECLIAITELPFFVLTLADVELAHLERVQFGLKNFDLVFVYKDYKRPVAHINSIPIKQLEDVKDWLDYVNIAFTEGPVNLQWPQIMKTVNEDTAGFFEDGGWKFLRQNSDDSDAEDSEELESEYEEPSDSESDFDEDSASDYSDEESAEESEFSGSESEGEDWEELERKAVKADRKKEDRTGDSGSKKKKKRHDSSEESSFDDMSSDDGKAKRNKKKQRK